MRAVLVVLVLSICAGAAVPAPACTCFSVVHGATVFVGRNYDWDFSDGLVLVNSRGLEKFANLDPEADSKSWIARYGSVTFNQYGRDFPCGGMNEQGLVVEVLWLDGSVYPPADERLGLDSVQWIQYQLDTAASVDEVLASLAIVRVQGTVAIHFYVADREGHAAAVEFLGGNAVVHRTGASMQVAALTNHTYEQSLSYLRGLEGWGGREPLPKSAGSLARFGRAASAARALAERRNAAQPADIFGVLQDVAQPGRTQWSVVYDLTARRIHFRTLRSAGIKSIDFGGLDFACSAPNRMLDVDVDARGDVAGRWREYTRAANRELIGRTYAKTEFLRDTTPRTLDALAAHPERGHCVH